jgi:hypothetical protein
VPLEEFTDNLKAMVTHARRAGAEDVLLITPGPVHEPARVQHNKRVSRRLHALCVALRMPSGAVRFSAEDALICDADKAPCIRMDLRRRQGPMHPKPACVTAACECDHTLRGPSKRLCCAARMQEQGDAPGTDVPERTYEASGRYAAAVRAPPPQPALVCSPACQGLLRPCLCGLSCCTVAPPCGVCQA